MERIHHLKNVVSWTKLDNTMMYIYIRDPLTYTYIRFTFNKMLLTPTKTDSRGVAIMR